MKSFKNSKTLKVKEPVTFWLFMSAYGVTALLIILDNFVYKVELFDLWQIVVFLGIFAFGFSLRLITIHHLGKYFDINIRIREDHHLIKKGIYKTLRHPMYMANLMIFVGGAGMFSSANGIAAALVLITPVTIIRIFKEEAFLTEKFGNEYRVYMKETNRLIPCIW